MKPKTRQVAAVACLGASVLLTGCTPSLSSGSLVDQAVTPPTSGCTEIGAEPGITVRIPPSAMERTAEITVTACTDDQRCAIAHRTAEQLRRDTVDGDTFIVVLWPYHDDHATVSIEHAISDSVVVTDIDLTLTVYSPNGPECEPHVLQAELDL
ncbi:MAG: hypothetical protein Q4P05_07260 [Actinomycetaceae bacterium]|nr:hypothetical protein [Actinomycetaceae bacterium]